MNLEKLKPYEQKDGIRKSSLSPFSLSPFSPPIAEIHVNNSTYVA